MAEELKKEQDQSSHLERIRTWKTASKIFNSDLMKLNKLLLRAVRNKYKNLKAVCAKSKTNSIPNNAVPPMPSKLTERWNAESKKSLTNLKKTRRTSPEFK